MHRLAHATVKTFLLATSLSLFVVALLGIISRVSLPDAFCNDLTHCSLLHLPGLGEVPLFPFLHQTVGLVAGFLMIVTVRITYRAYKDHKQMVIPLLIGVLFMLFQGLVPLFSWAAGADWMAGLHFLMALIVLALTLIPLVSIYTGRVIVSSVGSKTSAWAFWQSEFLRLVVWTSLAVFLLLASGTLVSMTNASQVCLAWPVCLPIDRPVSLPAWLNFFHRLLTLISALLMTRLVTKAWQEFRDETAILLPTTITVVLFFSQALMGWVESARGYPAYLIGLHSATSVSVWVSVVTLAILTWQRVPLRRDHDDVTVQSWGRRSLRRLILDYLMLTKPVVVLLLLVTTVAGMVVGGESWPSFSNLIWTLIAGFLAAGGSGAINQYIDRFDDLKMQRTRKRPLPSGRLTPAECLAFGVASVLISFYLMVSLVNFVAALLTLAGIIYYVLIYSILLKKTTVQNIVIGGGAGAIPPLVGWVAATGGLNIPALLLFAVVFLWTPPHFWALALVRRNDYARAGVPMLPVVRGEKETRWQIFLYTLELVILTLLLPVFGLGGSVYMIGAIVLGAYLLLFAWRVWKNDGNKVAWQMYRHSSMYLAFLFLVLMFDALI